MEHQLGTNFIAKLKYCVQQACGESDSSETKAAEMRVKRVESEG